MDRFRPLPTSYEIFDIGFNKTNMLRLEYLIFDFDGVFTDNSVYTNQHGEESVKCSRADGIGLTRLRDSGINMCVLSTESNDVVKERCQKLGITCYHDSKNKLLDLQDICGKDLSRVAFVGNDVNDLEVMRQVGLPIAVNDAYGEIKSISKWVTEKKGGQGAVREICDTIYQVRKEGK